MSKLEMLEAALKAATPGPWHVAPHNPKFDEWYQVADRRNYEICDRLVEPEAAAIVLLRNNADALLAIARAAQNLLHTWRKNCDCQLCEAFAALEGEAK